MGIALTVIVGILSATGGGTIGALVRQPEINKMKTQIAVLQKEIEESHKLSEKVMKDVELFRLLVQTEKNKDVLYNLDNEDYGKVLYAYGFYEYLLLKCNFLLDEVTLTEMEATFVDAFSLHLDNKMPAGEDGKKTNKFIKEYLNTKYAAKIKAGESPDIDGIIKIIESKISELEDDDISMDGFGKILPELDFLSLTEYQMQLLYSLEYNKVVYDISHTKKKEIAQKKRAWLKAWKNQILKSLDKKDCDDFFLGLEQNHIWLKIEYERNTSTSWYYVLMMEMSLFVPYFKLPGEDELVTKGLKLETDFNKDVIKWQKKYLPEDFFEQVLKSYSSSLCQLKNTTTKMLIAVGTSACVAICTGGLAGVFAPSIAVALVGGSFSSLSGAALTSASLAYIGGGALAAGGAGMAGGTALITGGGVLLGAMGSGMASFSSALLSSTPELTLRECAKLMTSVKVIVIGRNKMFTLAETICKSIQEKADLTRKQIAAVEQKTYTDKKEEKESKKIAKDMKESLKYLERANKSLKAYIEKKKKESNKQK